MILWSGVSGDVTAQNVCLLASWLIDHPLTDDTDTDPASPLNAESVRHDSSAAESAATVRRAAFTRDRSE